MQNLMPFIIKNIEANHDCIVYNGALKKNLYVMVLESLFNNELVKIDFHVSERSLTLETYHNQDLGALRNIK